MSNCNFCKSEHPTVRLAVVFASEAEWEKAEETYKTPVPSYQLAPHRVPTTLETCDGSGATI